VIDTLAGLLNLDPVLTAFLIEEALTSAVDTAKKAINDFLELEAAQETTPEAAQETTPEAAQETTPEAADLSKAARTTYERLHKVALLVKTFGLTTAEVQYIVTHGGDFCGLDFNNILVGSSPKPGDVGRLFKQWQRLRELSVAKHSFLSAETSPLDVFRAANKLKATLSSVLTVLTRGTGWNRGDVDSVCEAWHIGYEVFRNAEVLLRLRDAVMLAKRTLVPIKTLIHVSTVEPDAQQATNMRSAVKVRYDEETWVRQTAPVENVLREKLRAALVAYVLQLPEIRGQGIKTANQLFEHFLIDVEMGPQMKTSRIKQAISSVQLFVHRCLLNLEPEVSASRIDAQEWSWRRQYRVWEANRKVFLYPENFIEPECRDDKSPFFREMEEELLQSELTDDHVEVAFRTYLEKLNKVAQLEIVGFFPLYQTGQWDDPEDLHVFGRTYSVPHVHYYCRREDGLSKPWERVDLDIQSDHLIPIVMNRRLYLMWITMEKIAKAEDNPLENPSQQKPPKERWRSRLYWSEYRGGKWLPVAVSPQDIEGLPINSSDSSSGGWEPMDHHYYTHEIAFYINGSFVWPGAIHINVLRNREIWSGGLEEDAHWDGGLRFWEARAQVTALSNEDWDNWERQVVMPEDMQFSGMMLESKKKNHALKLPWQKYPHVSHYVCTPFLDRTKGIARLLFPPYQLSFVMPYTGGKGGYSFFFQDDERAYFVERSWKDIYQFQPFFHPHVCGFITTLNVSGITDLLDISTQQRNNDPSPSTLFEDYKPNATFVSPPYPRENVDFSKQGPYSLHNWELFFQNPVAKADRLSRDQKFEAAQRWFHFVFNPTCDTPGSSPQRYWRFLPFHEKPTPQRIQELLRVLADPQGDPTVKDELILQIREWEKHPFEPHRIARIPLRHGSYQKWVVMRYIDNLIAWGDQCFAQDTIESINEATQLYVLAANILGPRPERVPELATPPVKTYAELKASLDEFSNVLVTAQNKFPFISSLTGASGPPPTRSEEGGGMGTGASGPPPTRSEEGGGMGTGASGPPPPAHGSGTGAGQGVPMLYFGIPQNAELLKRWSTVEDRLSKIRTSRTLAGVTRQLALFEPEIEPALLVRAAAAGVDLGSALADLSVPLGAYRFSFVLAKAVELCAEVKALGNALLAALEKKDAEAMSRLRASHETSMLRLMRQIKEQQKTEAQAALDGLHKTREVTQIRHDHYDTIAFMNAWENANLALTDWALRAQSFGLNLDIVAGMMHMLPQANVGVAGISSAVVTAAFGGPQLGNAATAGAGVAKDIASILNTAASMSATMGSYERRQEEWDLQTKLAAKELEQIDKQILAAEARLDIAEREITNHDEQVKHAQEMEAFLRDKYTNEQLYGWMISQLSSLYFQTYQLAYGTAKRAERAFRFERGLTESTYVQFGYWESLKKGLLAGERLHLNLKRLEMAYLDQNAREYELTKHVSLVLHDPLGLITLKETGQCLIELPEALFDMDYPGHYFRRLKNVTLTIPCVVGPYTGINATLTLLSNRIRIDNSTTPEYGEDAVGRFLNDFSAMQRIVTSHAQDDAGMFELSFRDERYLPFEGAGVISRWRLEIPKETNAFDLDTITDVILNLRYTAREGGELLRREALQAAMLPPSIDQEPTVGAMGQPEQVNLRRLFSARHEFPDAWARFLHPAPAEPSQQLSFQLSLERFPFRFRRAAMKIQQMVAFLRLAEGTSYAQRSQLQVILRPPGPASDTDPRGAFDPHGAYSAEIPGLPRVLFDVASLGKGYGLWTIEVKSEDVKEIDPDLYTSETVNGVTRYRLKPEAFEDLLLVCAYTVPAVAATS
jgi:hypothetical protein